MIALACGTQTHSVRCAVRPEAHSPSTPAMTFVASGTRNRVASA